MSTYDLANELAMSFGFASAEDIKKQYEGKDVYIAKFKEVEYTGLPIFILCSSDSAEFAYPKLNAELFKMFK